MAAKKKEKKEKKEPYLIQDGAKWVIVYEDDGKEKHLDVGRNRRYAERLLEHFR